MQNFRVLLALSLCLITQNLSAYVPKVGNVTATLGPFLPKTHFLGSDSGARSTTLSGVALVANGDLNDKGALEVGLFQMPKQFFRDFDGRYIGEQTELLHITLGYRRWLKPWLSYSLSFYSSYTMGEPHIIHNDFPFGNDVDSSARDTTEYGMDLAIQTELWESGRYAAILDARYSYSVTNKSHEYANHYGALIGLRYFIQEQQIRDKTKSDL